MRLPGYCTECRRPRNSVRVSSHELALSQARGGGVVSGVCTSCERADDLLRQAARRFPLDLPARIDWLETQPNSYDAIQRLRNGR